MNKNKIAVMIIDMQDFFLKKLTSKNRDKIILNQEKLIIFSIKNKIPIIILKYKDRGDVTGFLKKELNKIKDLQIVTKEFNSGFRKTNLDQIIKNLKIKSILLAGVNASGCVQDNAIAALHRGYKIITSADLIASSSKRDQNLGTSKKWYPRKGRFFEEIDSLLHYLDKK